MPKHNPKEVVNIIQLVDESISKLNASCKEAKMDNIFSVRIIDTMTEPTTLEAQRGITPKKCKQLILTNASVETGQRITLYTVDYVIHNPAKILTSDYKRVLYRELLHNALGSFNFSLLNRVAQDRAHAVVDKPEKLAAYPTTMENAYRQ